MAGIVNQFKRMWDAPDDEYEYDEYGYADEGEDDYEEPVRTRQTSSGGSSRGGYSVDELEDATRYYLEQAARLAPQVPRDADGHLVRQDFFELAGIAGSSYEGLGQRWEIFAGPQLPVKALLVYGPILLYSGHTGIFWAPTGESGVPLDCADADRPFIMCHEAAHRLGIASEREANFAAFLACTSNGDVCFRYAG